MNKNPAITYLFVAGMTGDLNAGIHVFLFDAGSGALTHRYRLSDGARNPLFLRADPSRNRLYAANELGDGEGEISSYRFDPATGSLSLINSQPAGGTVSCYIGLDRAGSFLLAAHYGSGNTSVLPISATGELGPARAVAALPTTVESANAHSIVLDPNEEFAAVSELGADRVVTYRYNSATGGLSPIGHWSARAKAGPRHFVFHSDGRRAYVINELDSTIVAFEYEAGVLTDFQNITTLPPDFTGTSYCADIHIHPNGRFLYGSNRGHESIVAFAIDPEGGDLQFLFDVPTDGNFPRSFAIHPSGDYLLAANEHSHSIKVFGIDQATGALDHIHTVTGILSPACLEFWA